MCITFFGSTKRTLINFRQLKKRKFLGCRSALKVSRGRQQEKSIFGKSFFAVRAA